MIPIFSAQQMLEFEQGTKSLLAMLPTILEEFNVKAKVKRGKFDALVKEGFTEEQAMQIIVAAKDDMTL